MRKHENQQKAIGKGAFILGSGPEGTYSDLEIKVCLSEKQAVALTEKY